jgi:hypothetical protein
MIIDDLGCHSLRHFYGYYCANVLGLAIDIVQVMMHHALATSTQVYYGLAKSTVKQEVMLAILKKRGLEPEHIILPKTSRMLIPEHWTNRYVDKRQLAILTDKAHLLMLNGGTK